MTGRSLAVRRVCGFGIGIFLSVFSFHAFGGDEAATPLPRYKLEAGQQIQYGGGGGGTYSDGGGSHADEHWEFDVLGRNADGNYRLLYRMVKKRTGIGADGKEGPSDESVEVALVDMDTDGNMTELFGSFGYRSSPATVFPPLPANAKQLADGWQGPGSFGSTMHYRALPKSNAKEFVFSVEEEDRSDVIYDFQRQRTMTFDYEQGLPIRSRETYKQGWGWKSEGGSESKLIGVKRHDAEWAAKLKADAEQFFAAKQQFSKARNSDEATPESLDAAVAALKGVREKISSEEFQQQLEKDIEDFEKYRKYDEEDFANRRALIGRPAEDFKATDLDDKPQTLADYRGKVVVLDFWYRGCGWCIRAMPALEKVSEHYRGQPVAVLGMNTDQNIEDAKFVVDKMGPNYATLKAEGLPERFKVKGFPTLILIDQTGKIRDIHSGWKATLEHDLEEKIDQLLAEAK